MSTSKNRSKHGLGGSQLVVSTTHTYTQMHHTHTCTHNDMSSHTHTHTNTTHTYIYITLSNTPYTRTHIHTHLDHVLIRMHMDTRMTSWTNTYLFAHTHTHTSTHAPPITLHSTRNDIPAHTFIHASITCSFACTHPHLLFGDYTHKHRRIIYNILIVDTYTCSLTHSPTIYLINTWIS